MKCLLLFLILTLCAVQAADTSRFQSRQLLWPSQTARQAELEQLIVDNLRQYRRNLRQLSIEKTAFRQQVEESELILSALQSFGYYQAQVEPVGAQLRYRLRLGPVFHLGDIRFDNLDFFDPSKVVGLREGDVADAEQVLAAASDLQSYLDANHCLWQNNVDYRARIRPGSNIMDVTLVLGNSQQVRVSSLTFAGLQRVDRRWLSNRIDLQPGSCFNQSRLNRELLKLYNTNLFALVDYQLTQESDQVDVRLQFTERSPRTVKSAVGGNTDLGLYVKLGFEHRNLWRQGEKLTSDLLLAKNQQQLTNELTLPDLQIINSQLSFNANLDHLVTDFYDILFFDLGARLSQSFTPRVRGNIGGSYRLSYDLNAEELPFRNEFRFPAEMIFDSRNNRFDPRSGQLQSLRLEPVFDIDAFQPSLVNLGLGSSNFHRPKRLPNGVFATRLRIDWVQPWLAETLFADEKLYLGGTQDLRGYPFETVTIHGQGGLSKTAVSAEWRQQLSDSWGYSLFWDAGQLRRQPLIYSQEPWYQSLGAGIQFYTDFAPIRADFALPLTEVDGQKRSRFEFYLHIGQAF